ncbi:MAG: ATP-dependent RNA helicase HrpA [Corynebacterium sp.]|nr:ATP-dependent RNA helicase HrpA [Corynebacterium sp.]
MPQRSKSRAQIRRAHLPSVSYPAALPVSARVDDIKAAIASHQVVIIAGETGSGKTTQIPKICLELGRGVRGMIGHTQPRRIAARSVAERIATELGQEIGESVGYAIRFDDRVSPSTAIKLMTDGILLAELQHDRRLTAYDTIIIDEAHERSLNVDFLLGYLRKLLPRRPDLKVIITSATIDPERFASAFSTPDPTTGAPVPAPIIEVSGRTFPVEIRYRPAEESDEWENFTGALAELMAEGPGDVLCFFPGERDIRDAMDVIADLHLRDVEVTPLFGRLSNEEQHRIFSSHSRRRIVLATNIAETSLTVPGINYVIDTGLARISRYSNRTKVQRLPIEPISQASARQRSGRCGRMAGGIAIRLYSEADFESRDPFTEPEILRTNLASVILRMELLKLGDIRDFPFIDPPSERSIRDGMMLLNELSAIEPGAPLRLTQIGRTIARIPIDPRLARMLIAAEAHGVLTPVIIIVAALSIQDVRERPMEAREQADQLHLRFRNPQSDFASYLQLWTYLSQLHRETSHNQFRKRVRAEFLHYLRIREWRDLIRQLTTVADDLTWTVDERLISGADLPHFAPNVSATDTAVPLSEAPRYYGDSDTIHQALLAGLLSHVGMLIVNEDEKKKKRQRRASSREYLGARGTRFAIFPSSALAKKSPDYVMAAELIETSRLWASGVAAIDPRWVEEIAPAALTHTYSEPFWSTKRAQAMVHEKLSLYGVTLIADRVRGLDRIDPALARELLIRHGLIAGEWNHSFDFHDRNQQLHEEALRLEDRARRRDIAADEDELFRFYDNRLPAHITNVQHLHRWWKKTRPEHPHLLDVTPTMLTSAQVTEADYPQTWASGSLDFALSYAFEPGSEFDGVTVHIPVPLLASVSAAPFTWLVPGLRLELITALLRSLPKHLRVRVVPAPDWAARILARLTPDSDSLLAQLATVLTDLGVGEVSPTDFDLDKLPAHLRITFAAIDRRGTVIDHDKDLARLQQRQAGSIRTSLKDAGRRAMRQHRPGPQRQDGLAPVAEWTATSIGPLAEEVSTQVDGQDVTTYPALVVTAEGITVHVFPTRNTADAAQLQAMIALIARTVQVSTRQMTKGLPLSSRVAIENYPHGGVEGLIADARIAAVRDSVLDHGRPVRDPAEFSHLATTIATSVPARIRQWMVALAPGLAEYERISSELAAWEGPAIDDMRRQLATILPPQALSTFGMAHLKHLPRYMQALRQRLSDIDIDPDRDARRQAVIDGLIGDYSAALQRLPEAHRHRRPAKEIVWMIEELRVSLFAQQLGTAVRISEKIIRQAIRELR